MGVIFSEGSGLNKSIYGEVQAPIQLFIEKREEEFEKNSLLKYLFKMGTSENFGDLLTGLTGMNGFEVAGENGAYPNDSMQEGYSKLLRYVEWKNQFSISQTMIEDSKTMDLTTKPAAFMQAYGRTRELFGAAVYVNALKGNRTFKFRKGTFDCTSSDGKCAFATDHPSKVKGGNQSNKFSNEFSVDALDEAETRMQNLKGDNDEILGIAPDTILLANDAKLKRDVFAAIGADKDPMTANNGFNYQFGRWNVIIWPYLNQFLEKGDKPWMLLDSVYNETFGGAVWNDRIPLSVKSIIDETNDANVWKGRSRFNATFHEWRFACAGGLAGGTDLLA